MTAHRLTWILSLAVALAGSGLGCGDDKPSADASTTGGTGGSAGRGGTGGGTAGRGGAGGTGGTGGSAGTAGTAAGSGGSGSDASSDTAGTGGTGTGGTAGTGGAGGTGGTGGGTDAAADMAQPVDLPVDQPLPVDLPPDTQAATTVNVSDCAQFMCPQLTSIASQCQASETTCVHSKPGGDQINYCHSNGVKKVAHSTFNGNAYTTTMEVFKANSGDDCYTLEIQGTGGTPDMQNWTYKNTAGATLATATWRSDTGQLTIRCDNVNYVIGNVGCPGTDGQPDDTGAECPAGTCSEP